MTEQERIEEAERIVTRAGRGRAVFALGVAAIFLIAVAALGGAIVANVVNFEQDTKITNVERTACAKAPNSEECQRVKRRSDRARSVADSCIAFRKVGYPCPRPGSRVSLPVASGGDALQPASAGQQPSPATAPATEHVGGGHHHHSQQHAPQSPPASSPSPAPSPSPPSTPQPESPPPAAPGNSGETPAAEHSEGVKACVNLVVSACAEAGAPKLLP